MTGLNSLAWPHAVRSAVVLMGALLHLQSPTSAQSDWHTRIVINNYYTISVGSNTMSKFSRFFCTDSVGKFEQRYHWIAPKSGEESREFYETSYKQLVPVQGRYNGNNFVCIAGSGGKQKIICTRQSDAINRCWRRETRDCQVFHMDLGTGFLDACRGKCVNIAWIGRAVTFTTSANASSVLPVFSKGVCPSHPSAKLRTPAPPPTSVDPSSPESPSGRESRSVSVPVIVALSVACTLIAVLIATIIIFAICCFRKRQKKQEKRSAGVQTDSRPLSRPSFLRLLSQRIFRRARAPQQSDQGSDNASNSSPYYYEIASIRYENSEQDQQEEPESGDGEQCSKVGEYDYKRLHRANSGSLHDVDGGASETYGKDSACSRPPPDLLPDSERGCRTKVVSVSSKPPCPPKPKPRDLTLKIRP